MRNILVVTKGGCGKTTTAVHLAEALTLHGLKTVLVDADKQGSSILWGQAGQLKTPVVSLPAAGMSAGLVELAKAHDFVVLDCRPDATAPATLAALAVAGLAIVPCQTSSPDLFATTALLQLVAERFPGVPTLVVPTLVTTTVNSREVLDLMESSWKLSRAHLAARTCYREAATDGTTVHAMRGQAAARAAKEVNDLAFEVLTTLNKTAAQ
jgi:chromosome partitioning protein